MEKIDTSMKSVTSKKDSIYNDGDLSPIPISFEEAGYLKSIAISEEQDI